MKLEIKFDCDNAAFDDGADGCLNVEVSNILKGIAITIESSGVCGRVAFDKYQNVKDSRGNIVGTWRLK